jgi:hypothetical protein
MWMLILGVAIGSGIGSLAVYLIIRKIFRGINF